MDKVIEARHYKTDEAKIIYYYDKGCSLNQISRYTGCRYAKIRFCIAEYEKTGEIPKAKKRGRPTKLTNETLTAIMASTLENRAKPSYQIAKELFENGICEISTTTVNRGRHQLELNYKSPKVKQALTETQKADRIKFAHSLLANEFEFNRLIFSDESRFCLTSDNKCIWYRKGDYDEQCFTTREKFSISIMVFGAIGIDYKSELVFCEKSVDALYYREVIEKSHIIPTLDEKYGEGNWIFMQDGAPAHTARITTSFLQKRMKFLKIWPANSPDLNPIEHLWGAMKRILKNKEIKTKKELKEIIQIIWDSFPQESINRLIESFCGRLRMVLAVNGNSISDLLRKGIHSIPSFPFPLFENIWSLKELLLERDPTVNDSAIEFTTKLPWSFEEIILLLNKIKEFGQDWGKIGKFFPTRTVTSLCNKFNQLKHGHNNEVNIWSIL